MALVSVPMKSVGFSAPSVALAALGDIIESDWYGGPKLRAEIKG